MAGVKVCTQIEFFTCIFQFEICVLSVAFQKIPATINFQIAIPLGIGGVDANKEETDKVCVLTG